MCRPFVDHFLQVQNRNGPLGTQLGATILNRVKVGLALIGKKATFDFSNRFPQSIPQGPFRSEDLPLYELRGSDNMKWLTRFGTLKDRG